MKDLLPSHLHMLSYANYRVGDVVTIEDIYRPEPDWENRENFIGDLYVVTRIDSILRPSKVGGRNIWLKPMFRADSSIFRFSYNNDSRNFWMSCTKLKLVSKGKGE